MLLIIIILLLCGAVHAKSYPILEDDWLAAVETYSRTDEFKEKVIRERDMNIERILDVKGVPLPKAMDNLTYETAYSYTLEEDIVRTERDGNITGILYPKGYTFNPLLYLPIEPAPMIIFNPCDAEERAFVEEYRKTLTEYMLVSSGCALRDIAGYERQVYMLGDIMVKTFGLKSTVSVVRADIRKGVFNVRTFKVM